MLINIPVIAQLYATNSLIVYTIAIYIIYIYIASYALEVCTYNMYDCIWGDSSNKIIINYLMHSYILTIKNNFNKCSESETTIANSTIDVRI